MSYRLESRLLKTIVLGCLLLSSIATVQAEEQRIYTDEELEKLPAPGPNPYLSFLPAEAEVDWNYWTQKRDYEGRKRAEAAEDDLAGTVNEVEPNDTLGTAQPIPGFGTGDGDDSSIDVIGNVDVGGDVDCFEIDLEVGDILGVNQLGSPGLVEIFEPGGELQMGSNQSGAFLYPAESPLPGGANTADHVTYVDGGHFVCVRTSSGMYTIQLRVFRPVLKEGGRQQILFVDFDGATIDPSIFGGPAGDRVLSPLSSFLANWGLLPGDEDEVIDQILDTLEENIQNDLAFAANPNFGPEIRNSRDHADSFGEADVSRLIVGGTIAEFGIGTIGIAESIDPGNFGTEESAVILLDLLSAPAPNPNSLNSFGLAGGATIFDLIGLGVGNIVAHEAGHYLGNWHTEQFNASSDPSIMDQGGNLPGTVGVGPDGILGTADDFDTDFSPDLLNFNEGFSGTEHTDQKTAFAQSADHMFADTFEAGDFSGWAGTTPP